MKTKHVVFLSIICVAFVSIVAGVVLLAARGASNKELCEKEPISRPVSVAMVHSLSDENIRIFPGKVRGTHRVELAFSVSGLVKDLNIKGGQSVKRGEILALLDQRDFRNNLKMAKAKFVQAKKDLARFSTLREEKVIAEVKYEDTKTHYDVTQAELRLREKALEDTELRAPFDGVVVKRYIENHEHIRAEQPILSLQDISAAEVVIQVSERQMAHGGIAGLGQLKVHFDADTDRWIDASVCEYSAESDPVTGTYDVVVRLVPPADLKVFPGMTASVRTHIPDSMNGPTATGQTTQIPIEALCIDSDGETYVWVIDPDGGTPSKRIVTASLMCEDSAQISSGLKVGEYVATAGLSNLQEDIQVRPMPIGVEGLDK